MSMQWITHKGKRIITVDYTGMDEDAMIKQMQHYFETIANETEVLSLCNFGNILLSKGFRDKAKELRMNNKVSKKVKTALIGINKYQKANVFTYSFHTKMEMRVSDADTEAIEWLVSD